MSHAEESSRNRVLDAMTRLLHQGKLPSSMNAIAKLAGVSRATLYRHFRDRDELQRALQQQAKGLAQGSAGPKLASWSKTSRQRILEGARRAICDHGIQSVTVDQIARAAGVGEATIYRQFGDKDAILRAVFDELPSRRVVLTVLRDPTAPPRAVLLAIVEALLGFAAVEPEILRLVVFSRGPEQKYVRELRDGQQSAMARLVEYLAGQQQRGYLRQCPPMQLAGALLGATYARGLTLQSASAPAQELPATLIRKAADEVVETFLDGALAPKAQRTRRRTGS